MAVYMIGGSPCSGKSTIAQAISAEFGLRYFKVDDHLDRYIHMAAAQGTPSCAAVERMSPEQIWMRPPQVQCREELAIYREIFPWAMADLERQDAEGNVITEGAAWLPELARERGIPPQRYLSLTPTKEFQVLHYRRREWVPYVLEGCSDKAAAFANWMDRDALFAQAVRQQCGELGYASLVNDGGTSVEDIKKQVIAHFGLR